MPRPTSMRAAAHAVIERGAQPVSAASTAVFRVAFGVAAAWMAVRFVAMGRVESLLVNPPFHFHYPGLGWVAPLPAVGLYAVFVLMAGAGAAIALGWRYRIASGLFLGSFVYIESLDASLYLNHYELVTLVALLTCILPLHAGWSLDASAGRVRHPHTVSAVVVWLLRFQLAVVYVFAGLGKLNGDWLLRGEPLHTWLAGRTDQWLVGPMLSSVALAIALSWAGALFDVTIVGWLSWRRTRLGAYAVLVAFHLITARFFPPIGVFPWVMIVLTPIFFSPDWPNELARRWRGRPVVGGDTNISGSAPTDASVTGSVRGRGGDRDPVVRARFTRGLVTAAVVVYCVVQVVVPLRHLAYPGDVRWTEEGYRWSWRVLLTEKVGTVRFLVIDPHTGTQRVVWPGDELADHQAHYMGVRPAAIVEYAHHLAAHEEARTGVRPIVRADSWVSINGSRRARLVDPAVDLAALTPGWAPATWIASDPR